MEQEIFLLNTHSKNIRYLLLDAGKSIENGRLKKEINILFKKTCFLK
jgi:hypothetical protein